VELTTIIEQWTRFCNHSCQGFNASVRAVYVDDGNLARPLHVFFAIKDIKVRVFCSPIVIASSLKLTCVPGQPGEEILISYFSHEEPALRPGQTLKEYKAEANIARNKAGKDCQCFCACLLSLVVVSFRACANLYVFPLSLSPPGGTSLCRGVMFNIGDSDSESEDGEAEGAAKPA
jgi:hypothetical protein